VRTFGASVFLLVVGLICGVMIATLNIAFEPKNCGEDCLNVAWTSLLMWTPACTIAFPSIGMILWSRIGRTWKNLFIISLSLALLAMTPAGAVYHYRATHQTPTVGMK